MRRQAGFFDVDDRLKRLSDLGDQLEAFEAAVEFEAFRPELNAALTYSDGTQGGRPPFDPVMMFKILVIQTTNNLFRTNTRARDRKPVILQPITRDWAARPSGKTFYSAEMSHDAYRGPPDNLFTVYLWRRALAARRSVPMGL